jgi:hypothetical protein
MSLYVSAENQTLLWTIIHKNQLAEQYFLKISGNQKANWFKSIIQLFYIQHQNRNLNIHELQQINRDTLSYMVNYIRERISVIKDPDVMTSVPLPNSGPGPASVPLPAQDNPRPVNKQTMFTEQFNVRQKEYENMFEKKAPEKIDFAENIDDQPISNMDELIRTHMKQREDELRIYAPRPEISPDLERSGFPQEEVVGKRLNTSGQTPSTTTYGNNGSLQSVSNNSLIIDHSNENITISIDHINEPAIVKKNKTVSWTTSSSTDIPSHPQESVDVPMQQSISQNNLNIEHNGIEIQQMQREELESFKMIFREMSAKIIALQNEINLCNSGKNSLNFPEL